jgi:hypothetical protein
MAASETGPRSSRNATSIMAVTANRLLVLKRMVGSFLRVGGLPMRAILWSQDCIVRRFDLIVIFSD